MEHFFSPNSSTSNYWRGCRRRPYSNWWGVYSQVIGRDTSPPGFSTSGCKACALTTTPRRDCVKQRWSPRERPWPRGHILKSLALASKVKSLALASRPQVLENWPVLGSRTALFFELLKFRGALEKFFGKRFFVEIAWKIFVKTSCLSSERPSLALASDFFLCPWPWPRALCPRLHFWYQSGEFKSNVWEKSNRAWCLIAVVYVSFIC